MQRIEKHSHTGPTAPLPMGMTPLAISCGEGTATIIGGGGLPLYTVQKSGIDFDEIAKGFLAEAVLAPQIVSPIGHLVCSNKDAENPDHAWQLLQSMRAMRASGVDHRHHGWLAVSHGKHLHVLFNRVRHDGTVLHNHGAMTSLSLERARMDQEAGFGHRLDALSGGHPLVRKAFLPADRGDLAFTLKGDGKSRSIPVQGPEYEQDILTLGWTKPTATAGTWTIKHCVSREYPEMVRMVHHVLGKAQAA